MKRRKSASKEKIDKNASTVIGDTISLIDVTIKGIGIMRIDGSVTGKIDLEGHLIISQNGSMEGEINSASAMISGLCKGDIKVAGTLHLTSTAKVIGHVEAGKIVVDEGASLRIACFINEDTLPPRENVKNKDGYSDIPDNEDEDIAV